MVFIPGRSVNIQNDRVFIDGEEVSFPDDGQPIVSEGRNGAGDVVIGNLNSSDTVEDSDDGVRDSDPVDDEITETSEFRNIEVSTPDIIADRGQNIRSGTRDINIGNTDVGSTSDESDTRTIGDIQTDDIIADEGETVVEDTDDVDIGNTNSSNISGADSSVRDSTDIGDFNRDFVDDVSSKMRFLKEDLISDIEIRFDGNSMATDIFDDSIENGFDDLSFDFDFGSSDIFI